MHPGMDGKSVGRDVTVWKSLVESLPGGGRWAAGGRPQATEWGGAMVGRALSIGKQLKCYGVHCTEYGIGRF